MTDRFQDRLADAQNILATLEGAPSRWTPIPVDPPHQESPEELNTMEIPGDTGVAPRGTLRREARTGGLQDNRPRPHPVEGPRR